MSILGAIQSYARSYLLSSRVDVRAAAVLRAADAFGAFGKAEEEKEVWEPDELWVNPSSGGPGRRAGEASARPAPVLEPAGPTPLCALCPHGESAHLEGHGCLGGDCRCDGYVGFVQSLDDLGRPAGFYTTMDAEHATRYYRFPEHPIEGQGHWAPDGGHWMWQDFGERGFIWGAMNYPPTGDPYQAVKAQERAARKVVGSGVEAIPVEPSPQEATPEPTPTETFAVLYEVIAKHKPVEQSDGTVRCYLSYDDEGRGEGYRDWPSWYRHVTQCAVDALSAAAFNTSGLNDSQTRAIRGLVDRLKAR